jgi:CDP-glycerol glycerophosphotransferase (TagB/SpsB family)
MLFVFMSQPDFACNPHALWKYITEHTDHDTAWIVKKVINYNILNERGIKCAVYDTLESCELLESADVFIANSYTFLNIPKKDNQLLVNLWHGSGVKAHDYYDHNLNPRHVIKLKNYFGKVDLMCVHSLDDRFKLSAMLHFDLRKIYVTGQPRLDLVTTSDGKNMLKKIFGEGIEKYDHLIFFAPSYRSNMSCHAGKIYSDNIFRLDDFDKEQLNDFLVKNNAALIYKLHPIEQTAFSGRNFEISEHCYELTERILFDNDIRYDEMLNAFDIMISDYSSIVFDYLLLDRPVVYLLPDFDEYKTAKGFVFSNIDAYMPGEKAYNFSGLLTALANALADPNKYAEGRKNVILNRFEYTDGKSTERCYRQIMEFEKISDDYVPYASAPETIMPSIAEQICRYIKDDSVLIIDSRKEYDKQTLLEDIDHADKVYYITAEIPSKFRSINLRNSYKVVDLSLYNSLREMPAVHIAYITGGVDYNKFSSGVFSGDKCKTRIGFAGTVDNRIYFSMVQCICEEFSDCEVVFAGTIVGDFPAWLNGFDNLKYIEAAYDELPAIIASFDVAILPFFGSHKKLSPCELFQYLACGKSVVASNMPNLPECDAIYTSDSITEALDNIHLVLSEGLTEKSISSAKETAREHDWEKIAQRLLKDEYNYCVENEGKS